MREKLSRQRHVRFFIIQTKHPKLQKMNKLVFDAIQTCKASTKQNRKNFAKTKRQFWKIISQIRTSELTLSKEEESRLEICKTKMR